MYKVSFSARIKMIFFCSSFLLVSCAHSPKKQSNEYMTGSTLWLQTAGEFRALGYQAFQWAKVRLGEAIKAQGHSSVHKVKGVVKQKNKTLRPAAVIVDIDETILDNSPFQARSVLDKTTYPIGWQEWVHAANATAVPGAVEFLKFAQQKRVEVFYISNRKVKDVEDTFANLVHLGLPVKRENLLFRDKASSKTSRRQQVEDKFDVLLLVGDNLNDFADDFEEKSVEERHLAVEKNKELFGTKFIVIPNPMYGDWENAIYQYKNDLSAKEKKRLRHQHLRRD